MHHLLGVLQAERRLSALPGIRSFSLGTLRAWLCHDALQFPICWGSGSWSSKHPSESSSQAESLVFIFLYSCPTVIGGRKGRWSGVAHGAPSSGPT